MRLWKDPRGQWNVLNENGEVIVTPNALVYADGSDKIYMAYRGRAEHYIVNLETLEVLPLENKYDKLEEIELDMATLDTRAVYPFCLHYDSVNELSKRLAGTIIIIGNEPVYVTEVYERGGYFLAVKDRKDRTKKVNFETHYDKFNIRSYPPGYISGDRGVEFLSRIPARISRQGMCDENTRLFSVGIVKQARRLWDRLEDLPGFLSALKDRSVTEYDASVLRVLEKKMVGSVRLSPNVSVYRGKTGPAIEYKNRELGCVENGCVIGNDTPQSWIIRDLKEVNLNYREA